VGDTDSLLIIRSGPYAAGDFFVELRTDEGPANPLLGLLSIGACDQRHDLEPVVHRATQILLAAQIPLLASSRSVLLRCLSNQVSKNVASLGERKIVPKSLPPVSSHGMYEVP
jgi:hypothetical protein